MVGVVAVGFALNFGIRAVPFAIFGSRKGELPKWVTSFGAFVSPVIIAGLIIYSYSGLAWKTVWPYLAGLITVALHVWKRNPLVSIVVGTVLYMCFLNCGCTSQRIVDLDARNPSIRVAVSGLYFGRERVSIREVPGILDDYDIPKSRTIHIRLEPDVKDLREARALMAFLAHEGYTRPVLVTPRHSESFSTGKKKKPAAMVNKSIEPPRKIRYKKAGE